MASRSYTFRQHCAGVGFVLICLVGIAGLAVGYFKLFVTHFNFAGW